MKILLIEDDDDKLRHVLAFLESKYPTDEIVVRRSFQSGLKELVVAGANVVILDMTMPNYDVATRDTGGRERRYAGVEVLRQMRRRSRFFPTIILTQYEQFEEEGREVTLHELSAQLLSDFEEFLIGTVFYDASGSLWMDELSLRIDRIRASMND